MRIGRLIKIPCVQALLLLLLFGAAFRVPLLSMIHTWSDNPDYSYGFLMPLLALYFVWDRRKRLAELPVVPAWPMLPVLLVMVAVALYGILGSSGNVSRPALPFLIILFTLFCFGYQYAKRLFLPLVLLIFMVPVPDLLERNIGVWLKLISSKLAVGMIRLSGITVFLNGNVIDLGFTKLQVVDACSGLRFLFPLIALGIVYAAIFEKVHWKRIVCVVATIPIAVFTNGMRIGLTGILANRFGSRVTEGFTHDFTGWIIFMISFGILFLLGRVLRLFPTQNLAPAPLETAGDAGTTGVPRSAGAFIVAVLILLVVAAIGLTTKSLPEVKLRNGIQGFPLSFAGWNGKPDSLPVENIQKSGAQEAFSAEYGDGRGGAVSLYLGYRASAFMENENFFHSPTVCLPSSGWQTLSESRRLLAAVPPFKSITAQEMIIENMGEKLVVYFWFQTKARTSSNKDIHRAHLSLHALQHDPTYALFVRLIAPVRQGEQVADVRQRIVRFSGDMMPAMQAYFGSEQQHQSGIR